MRELLSHPVKRREETWREMMEAGEEEEGVVVAEEDLEGVVTSEAAEDFVVVSAEDSEVVVEDSVEIEADSVVAAGQEELGADSVEVGEVSVEATTEEKAVLNSPILHHHKFSKSFITSSNALAGIFFINSSLDFLLYSK